MRLTKEGVAVLDIDTHISKWVEEHGTLKIAEKFLRPFQQYIPVGGTVFDIGACIGDHTVTYAEWVGPNGSVVAFEPNPEAYKCLSHNTASLPQVLTVHDGLSDVDAIVSIKVLDNAGASYLLETEGDIYVGPLDYYEYDRVDFIKIDVEGYEVKVLKGASETINKCRPVMLIEVNSGALERSGSSATELLDLLVSMKYSIEITDPRIPWTAPQYDVVCLPIK